MKIKHLFLSVLAMASVAVACDKENQNSDKPSLKLDPATVEFEATAGTKTVKVDANQAWAIDGNDYDWVTLSQEEGDGASDVEITVLANSGLERTAKITFRCSIVKKTLTIKQTGEGKIETITVEEFIKKADTENFYTLSGTVSGFNSQYCSFDITDATGKIYVYSVTDASKAEWSGKIANGGKVVVSGKYKYYADKSQHEVVEATILSYEAGETPDYTKAEAKTVAEFIAAANATTYYKLTGKVSGLNDNTEKSFISFDLTDNTGKIYVYSVANKSEWFGKLKNEGTVTVAGQYLSFTDKNGNTKDEVVNAYIISFEAGEETDYTKAEAKTVAEFIAAASEDTYYKLTGTVSNLVNSSYISFDLTDATGTIYVYSVSNKADWKDKIKNEATVVLAGKYLKYGEKDEVVDAVILSCEGGKEPEPVAGVAYELTTATEKGKNNTYAGNGDITVNNITWNFNGNATMNPWRMGGKDLNGVDRVLYSKTAISQKIAKVVVEHGTANDITVNSMTLSVHDSAEDAASGANAVSTLNGDFVANGTTTFVADKDWTGKFYRIVYNVTVAKSDKNYFIQFKSAKFCTE